MSDEILMGEVQNNQPLADIPVPNVEFDDYLKETAKTEQLYSIALFDILGFSNYVEQNGIQSILDLYYKLLDLVYRQQSTREGESCITGVVPVPVSQDCKENQLVAQGNGFVNVMHFSDTFLIYVNYDLLAPAFLLRDFKHEEYPLLENEIGARIPFNFIRNHRVFISFLQTCMEFFCSALTAGIPLRGCISTGFAVMNKFDNVFIGKPLVEAAKGETERKSIGITFGKSFLNYHPIYNDLFIPYLAHIKEGYENSKYLSPMALDWPRYWRSRSDFNKFSISDCVEKMNHDQRFSFYYDNAIRFAAFSSQHHDWTEKINREGINDIHDYYQRVIDWYNAATCTD